MKSQRTMIHFVITKSINIRFRDRAVKKFGQRKGALSDYFEYLVVKYGDL
jgi:hypothetical protein